MPVCSPCVGWTTRCISKFLRDSQQTQLSIVQLSTPIQHWLQRKVHWSTYVYDQRIYVCDSKAVNIEDRAFMNLWCIRYQSDANNKMILFILWCFATINFALKATEKMLLAYTQWMDSTFLLQFIDILYLINIGRLYHANQKFWKLCMYFYICPLDFLWWFYYFHCWRICDDKTLNDKTSDVPLRDVFIQCFGQNTDDSHLYAGQWSVRAKEQPKKKSMFHLIPFSIAFAWW